jgi:hypothetical protein
MPAQREARLQLDQVMDAVHLISPEQTVEPSGSEELDRTCPALIGGGFVAATLIFTVPAEASLKRVVIVD